MDGWYVRQLLLNSDAIRSNIVSIVGANTILDSAINLDLDITQYNIDYDDSVYDDLLSVEIVLKQLKDKNFITDRDCKIVSLFLENKSITYISEAVGLSRNLIMAVFYKVCAKIAFTLGGIYTNEGYLEMLCKKHNLTIKQSAELLEILER